MLEATTLREDVEIVSECIGHTILAICATQQRGGMSTESQRNILAALGPADEALRRLAVRLGMPEPVR